MLPAVVLQVLSMTVGESALSCPAEQRRVVVCGLQTWNRVQGVQRLLQVSSKDARQPKWKQAAVTQRQVTTELYSTPAEGPVATPSRDRAISCHRR